MEQQKDNSRKFIGIRFECCGVYARLYLNERLKAYSGCCPKCTKRVRIEVDQARATTNQRFFRAY